jgi:hypothetical protein
VAHFARLDENNIVTQVIVVSNDELMDGSDESESKGIAFCQSLFGADTRWVQTSYNANFRGVYAGIGFTYDPDKDEFIAPPMELPEDLKERREYNALRFGEVPNNSSSELP